MHLICLTPTYGRPSLVANALALFLAQRLRDGDTAHMLIFDDAGQIAPYCGFAGPLSYQVMTGDTWVPLTRKYAPMLEQAGPADAWVVWDDDDVYLPWHLAAHAAALETSPWSHPSQAWSTCGCLHTRPLSGRHYHGALAIRNDLMQQLGGWPDTDRSDYDKQQLARCWRLAGPPGDPCRHAASSYVYRWSDTGRDHCSARSRVEADNVRRYQPPRIQEPGRVDALEPCYDASTLAILGHLCP